MTKPSRVFLILLMAFTLPTVSNAVELNGVVKSENGTPLSGVQILTYAPEAGDITLGNMTIPTSTRRHEVTTDANGKFRIPSHGQVIYFYRADLRPLSKIIDLSITQLEVIMEDGAKSLWKVPTCSASDKTNRVGIGFLVTVPPDILARPDEGRFEGGGFLFGYRNKGRIEMLINWWESTSLQPSEETLLKSKEFSERRWVSGDMWGYDFRGTMPDGKLWRRITTRNGALTYQGNSAEAAKVFDGMMDMMCFDESAVK